MVHNGWDGERTSLKDDKASPRRVVQGIQNADVVVIHRPVVEETQRVVDLVRQMDKKVVMDNDDTLLPDSGIPTEMTGDDIDDLIEYMSDNVKEFIPQADLVTASTEFLAEEYRQIADNVKVLPNCVDPLDWPEPKENTKDTVRIGLVGTAASSSNYEPIEHLMPILSEREDVELIVFAFPQDVKEDEGPYHEHYGYLKEFDVKFQHHVEMHRYFRTLNDLRLDIMLIPRRDSYFNRAKSNLKFLEASMLEIPCISQGFEDGLSPYQVSKNDAEYQKICYTQDDWYDAVFDLISDEEGRRQMGKEARGYVLDNYHISDNAHLWKDAYQSIT